MASAPGWGNLHAPPGCLQQLSRPLPRAHLAHPSRQSHGSPRATPGGSVAPQPALLVGKGGQLDMERLVRAYKGGAELAPLPRTLAAFAAGA